MLIDPDVLDFTSQSLLYSITGKEKGMRQKGSIYLMYYIKKEAFLKQHLVVLKQIVQLELEQHLCHLFFFFFISQMTEHLFCKDQRIFVKPLCLAREM